MSYLGHSLGESNPSAEMQLVYSTTPAEWEIRIIEKAFDKSKVLKNVSSILKTNETNVKLKQN